MNKKKIARARVTRRKETPMDKFFRIGLAMCNRYKVTYGSDNSLWFGILTWNKYSKIDLYQHIEKVMEYDQLHKNHKRIEEWQELLSQGLTVDEIVEWAESEYDREWNKLMTDIDNQIKNSK